MFADDWPMLTRAQIQQFHDQGFLVLPAFSEGAYCESVIAFAQQQLAVDAAPIEYEAQTQYPGAPASLEAEGGGTARRLLNVACRTPLLNTWATGAALREVLLPLLGEPVFLSQAHHNCIMTKQPRYSSVTGWHRDSRYWSFARAELISAWLALRTETVENGCLWVLPGSHQWAIAADQLDALQFLREDLPVNQLLLQQAQAVTLQQGDLLLFHSNLFHAAGRNHTQQTKFSLVFTYRAASNTPTPNTRSTSLPEIPL